MTREEKVKKLSTLPWQALHDNAIKYGISKEEVGNKDKNTIISIILSHNIFDDEKIEELVGDYIYGDRITFTLWKLRGSLLSDEQKDIILGLDGMLLEELNLSHFKKLSILSVKDIQGRYEILYVYLKEYAYINEKGYIDSVWEQHRGCVWIGQDIPYMACISKHDKMTIFISNFLAKKVGTNISQIKPPKNAIEKCIREQVISRKVLQGINGEKTVISNSEGLTDAQLAEMDRIRDERIDTSGSYLAEIEKDIRATIKYNISKGNLGIHKHLPSKVLFEWSQKAIGIIFEEIEKLKTSSLKELEKALGVSFKWPLLSESEKEEMNCLFSQVLKTISEPGQQLQIQISAQNVLQKSDLFVKIPRIYCVDCDSYEIAYCEDCGGQMSFHSDGQLMCPICHSVKAVCSEGHRKGIVKYMYIPTEKSMGMIRKNLAQVNFGGQDFKLYVLDDVLYVSVVQTEDMQTEIQFDSVECFKDETGKMFDLEQYKEAAVKMNEKCKGICSHEKVNKCVNDDTMICLPKLFYKVIPGFRPQPHKGSEYGDISGEIKVENRTYEMKGIIKKNTKNNGRNSVEKMMNTLMLSTSTEGQGIIRQFVQQGMIDQRCELLAVVAPQYFDADLKGTLRYLAKLSNKKVLFIELDGICKILSLCNQMDERRNKN